jgi:flagellar biosynthesis component FlhA
VCVRIVEKEDVVNDLLENLKRFLEAGDESRSYMLNRDEVRFVVKEIERLRAREIKILSFADIRDDIRRQERERAERIRNAS